MAIRMDDGGVGDVIGKVSTAIDELDAAAKAINDAMDSLGNYWEGAAYNYTMEIYESEYRKFLTDTVPSNVESLRKYIEKCKDTILEVDAQLAGGGSQ